MYDDFYREPTEFEEQIAEFKAALREAVKKEFLEKMEALEKENASLREFSDKKAEYDRELSKMRWEHDAAIANAKRDAERMRANELVRSLCVTGYRANSKYTQRPKCSRCDENRKIHYKSPMGRDCWESCECDRKLFYYEPKETKLIKFSVRDSGISACYFERTDEGRDYDMYDLNADIYEQEKEQEFGRLNQYRTVFLEESNCKAYCDFLNGKAQSKS